MEYKATTNKTTIVNLAGYIEKDLGDAGADEGVSPVEAKVGPDGNVWVADPPSSALRKAAIQILPRKGTTDDALQRATLRFTAPTEPGEYPFICTFPGHWRIMQGVMKVVAN